MSFPVKFRIIFQTILNGATDNCFGFNKAVSFRYYKSEAISRFSTFRCPVVFHCFAHQSNLFRSEPGFDKLVGLKYFAGMYVMIFSAVNETEVMKGCDDISHIADCVRLIFHKFQTLFYDHIHMVGPVCFVK